MPRNRTFFLIALVLLTLSLSGCDLFRQRENPEVDLTEIFPDDLPAIGQAQRLNVDNSGRDEWLVFYHVDLVQDRQDKSPIAAAVYHPVTDQDSRLPPHLVPTLIWLPRRGYPCYHDCEAEMRDVISKGPGGTELVIKDNRDGDTVGVAIFRWESTVVPEADDGIPGPLGRFIPLGHFRADLIEVEKDRVTLIRRLDDRSDLATREVYEPQLGRYYVDPAEDPDRSTGQLRSPEEAEIVFAFGPPQEPSEVKLPEKLVLSFYHNYRDREEIARYTTASARDKVADGCPPGTCGCSSHWQDISRVMVKQIAYETEDKPVVSVVVQVLCENKNGQFDDLNTVTWKALRLEDNTWQLIDVVPGGQEYLCTPSNCGW